MTFFFCINFIFIVGNICSFGNVCVCYIYGISTSSLRSSSIAIVPLFCPLPRLCTTFQWNASCLLTVRIVAEAVWTLSVSGGYPCRQWLPQLKGERVFPLRQLQSRYQLRSREAPPLLVTMTTACQKTPSCGHWRLCTPTVLAKSCYWVFSNVQWFCR